MRKALKKQVISIFKHKVKLALALASVVFIGVVVWAALVSSLSDIKITSQPWSKREFVYVRWAASLHEGATEFSLLDGSAQHIGVSTLGSPFLVNISANPGFWEDLADEIAPEGCQTDDEVRLAELGIVGLDLVCEEKQDFRMWLAGEGTLLTTYIESSNSGTISKLDMLMLEFDGEQISGVTREEPAIFLIGGTGRFYLAGSDALEETVRQVDGWLTLRGVNESIVVEGLTEVADVRGPSERDGGAVSPVPIYVKADFGCVNEELETSLEIGTDVATAYFFEGSAVIDEVEYEINESFAVQSRQPFRLSFQVRPSGGELTIRGKATSAQIDGEERVPSILVKTIRRIWGGLIAFIIGVLAALFVTFVAIPALRHWRKGTNGGDHRRRH